MKNTIKSLLFITTLAVATPAISKTPPTANPVASLGGCLVDSLDGKERKLLAKWIFFAIAAHPEIKQFSKMTEKDIEDTDKSVGALITRLLTVDCEDKFKAAQKVDRTALPQAFRLVGEVAMKELMQDKSVTSSITGYAKYIDKDKITALMKGK